MSRSISEVSRFGESKIRGGVILCTGTDVGAGVGAGEGSGVGPGVGCGVGCGLCADQSVSRPGAREFCTKSPRGENAAVLAGASGSRPQRAVPDRNATSSSSRRVDSVMLREKARRVGGGWIHALALASVRAMAQA